MQITVVIMINAIDIINAFVKLQLKNEFS